MDAEPAWRSERGTGVLIQGRVQIFHHPQGGFTGVSSERGPGPTSAFSSPATVSPTS